jgi:hypothetical protein
MAAPATLLNHKLLTGSLRYFARNCLKIKTDDGLINFEFNMIQEYLHYHANEQLKKQGYVRIAFGKARQLGGSEYISARGYRKAIQRPATSVYILSHEAKSTGKLFAKVKRYDKYIDPTLRPASLTANGFQCKWANESEYTVGTAGTEDTGRSDTTQFGHLSECAQDAYGDGDGVKAGLMQTVADGKGTELWAETTTNGKNWWYYFIQDIVSGVIPDWIFLFAPWWWCAKYQKDPPEDFEATADEERIRLLGDAWDNQLKKIVSRPLTNAQLYWRRCKIGILKEKLFKQEYPSNFEESAQATGGSFIESTSVELARKSQMDWGYGATILGVDAGRSGDRTIIWKRKGRRAEILKKFDPAESGEMDEMTLAAHVIRYIKEEDAQACFMDYAQAYGAIDRCRELGWGHIVHGVFFNETPNEAQYFNKRAEMFFQAQEWLEDKGGCRLSDDQDMANDFAAIPNPKLRSDSKWQFPAKAEIKKEFGRSPDIWDGFVLTFAESVAVSDANSRETQFTENVRGGLSELTTAARIRQGEGETSRPLQEKRELRRSGREAY